MKTMLEILKQDVDTGDLLGEIMGVYWPNGTTAAQDSTFDSQANAIKAILDHYFEDAAQKSSIAVEDGYVVESMDVRRYRHAEI